VLSTHSAKPSEGLQRLKNKGLHGEPCSPSR
jgi:hypothetical protein